MGHVKKIRVKERKGSRRTSLAQYVHKRRGVTCTANPAVKRVQRNHAAAQRTIALV